MKKILGFVIGVVLFISLDSYALEKNQGYILIAINIEGGYIPTKATMTSKGFFNDITVKPLRPRLNYELIAVDSGVYTWDRIYYSSFRYVDLEDEEFSIKVEKGKINYGGQISVYSEMSNNQSEFLGGISVNFNNKSSKALAFLESQHSDLLKTYGVIYSGNQRDDFFVYARSLGEHKNED